MIPVVPASVAGEGDAAAGCVQESGPMLWLRGLPANTSEQDLFAWFSAHGVIECVADTPDPLHLVTESSPLGEKLLMLAVVETRSARDAATAQRVLDGQIMQMCVVRASLRGEFTTGGAEVQASHVPYFAPLTPSPSKVNGVGDNTENLRALLSPGALPYTLPWASDANGMLKNPTLENCAWTSFLDSFARQGQPVGHQQHQQQHQQHRNVQVPAS